MPRSEIESSTASSTPRKMAHERLDGPWDDWELMDGAHHLERADKIAGNTKYLEAIRKHSEKKAKHHRDMAHHAGMLAKSGRISPKAMKRVKDY